jgi:chemotaxis-related protein WspB
MLFVQFYLDEFRYVLATKDVVEVVPCVKLKPVPQAEEYIAGLFNFRGISVPVIDLNSLLLNKPSASKLSTRIILLCLKNDANESCLFGIKVEKATETIKIDEKSFKSAAVDNSHMPILGPVYADTDGLVTRINPQDILPLVNDALLFSSES